MKGLVFVNFPSLRILCVNAFLSDWLIYLHAQVLLKNALCVQNEQRTCVWARGVCMNR